MLKTKTAKPETCLIKELCTYMFTKTRFRGVRMCIVLKYLRGEVPGALH